MTEDRQTSCTSQGIEQENPPDFLDLLRTVWGIFEIQLCENGGALQMLNSAAEIISSDQMYGKMEQDFKLGKLGEYVEEHEETLPFLATIIAHFHRTLEECEKENSRRNEQTEARRNDGQENDRLNNEGQERNDGQQADNSGRALRQEERQQSGRERHRFCHAMTSFLEELESKMGSDERTKLIVAEISEKASQAADNMEMEHPAFAESMREIGVCVRDSWIGLKNEVERCVRRVKKKKYSSRSMQKIYTRVICKGMEAARNIQDKINSVSSTYEPRTTEAANGNYRYEDEMNANVGG